MIVTQHSSNCVREDPDILVGWEVQMSSWGYLIARAGHLGVDLKQELSRMPGESAPSFADAYGKAEIRIIGVKALLIYFYISY